MPDVTLSSLWRSIADELFSGGHYGSGGEYRRDGTITAQMYASVIFKTLGQVMISGCMAAFNEIPRKR